MFLQLGEKYAGCISGEIFALKKNIIHPLIPIAMKKLSTVPSHIMAKLRPQI